MKTSQEHTNTNLQLHTTQLHATQRNLRITRTAVLTVVLLSAALGCDKETSHAGPVTTVPDASTGNGGSSNGGSSGHGGTANGGAATGGTHGNADAGLGGSSNTDAGDGAVACMLEPDAGAACGNGANSTVDIVGEYTDDFGGTVTIEDCAIFGNPVTEVSNVDMYFVTQNPCSDPFSPGKWSRYDWTWYAAADGGAPELYYCTEVYNADTEADAIAAPRADASDPDSSGCGGMFPWTKLVPVGSGADASTPDAAVDAGDGG